MRQNVIGEADMGIILKVASKALLGPIYKEACNLQYLFGYHSDDNVYLP